jgi:hypothetical protein
VEKCFVINVNQGRLLPDMWAVGLDAVLDNSGYVPRIVRDSDTHAWYRHLPAD